jgi:lipopolysaccharide export system protein LptA
VNSKITAGSIILDGKNSVFSISNKLVYSNDILKIAGWSLSTYAIEKGSVKLDSANEKITAGSIIIDGKNNLFNIASKLVYENNSLSLAGTITAKSGSIAGWSLSTYAIEKGTVKLDSANEKITAGSIIIDGKNNEFYIGDKLTFKNGNLTIDQELDAKTGHIGGWSISTYTLSSTNVVMDSQNSKITAGSIIIDGKNNEFKVGN